MNHQLLGQARVPEFRRLALDSWPLPGLVSVSSNCAAPNPAGPSPRIVPIQLACAWLEGARNPSHLLLLPIEWGGFPSKSFRCKEALSTGWRSTAFRFPCAAAQQSISVSPDATSLEARTFQNQDSLEYQSIIISHSSII